MKQVKVDFAKLLKGYKPGWVGISRDHTKVLVWGKTLKEAAKKANKFGEEVYYFPSGRTYDNFVG